MPTCRIACSRRQSTSPPRSAGRASRRCSCSVWNYILDQPCVGLGAGQLIRSLHSGICYSAHAATCSDLKGVTVLQSCHDLTSKLDYAFQGTQTRSFSHNVCCTNAAMLLHVGVYGQCSWSGHASVLHGSVCLQGLDKFNIEKDIAQFIKKEFDRKHSPTWHCIVGRNFGRPEASQECTSSLIIRVSNASMQLNMHKEAFSDVATSSCRLLRHPRNKGATTEWREHRVPCCGEWFAPAHLYMCNH